MPNIRLILSHISNNPLCPHGPTLLFSRLENGETRNFFACSACRDRKDCAFFLWQDELEKFSKKDQNMWQQKAIKYTVNVNHIALFTTFNDMKNSSTIERVYCGTCESFQPKKYVNKHEAHDLKSDISDRCLDFPSEFLKPLDNSRKEAQYFFSTKTVDTFIKILKDLQYTNVLCIGTPRIHEKIRNDCPEMTSLLLDFDKRFHNFFGPLEFCWYNLYNHHFFKTESKKIFTDFVKSPGKTVLVADPPFGGRLEPLADSINKINKLFAKSSNVTAKQLDIFLFFPYFMEGQIKNSFPTMEMMDYKVDYDIQLFNGHKDISKAKFGSLVRIFTNIQLSKIVLPTDEGYKYCKRCDKYVSIENRHCRLCKACTSKNGRRYKHCAKCQRCVKPTWQHCQKCNRCALKEHECGEILFLQECFHCNESGHKKKACPQLSLNTEEILPKTDKKRKIIDRNEKNQCNKVVKKK